MFKLADFLKIFLNQFRIRNLHPSQLRALYLPWDQYFPQLITTNYIHFVTAVDGTFEVVVT